MEPCQANNLHFHGVRGLVHKFGIPRLHYAISKLLYMYTRSTRSYINSTYAFVLTQA